SADAFDPDRPITRAEVAKLLTLMLARDPDRQIQVGAGNAQTFTDVTPAAWHYAYVETAARLGLVRGSDGQFRPDDPVTREELAVMIIRALGLEQAVPTADPLQLQDLNQTADWSHKAVLLALENGLMRGVSSVAFDPQGVATRAQAAAVVLRALLHAEQQP
ncbi:MAG TPA: S-layer homology domain-containing protein, partial [Symbiobacteriaceae bacterium]|nr:S-layer homology domain-containing protein [Symbiobacteriaceae bacterium]